MSLLLVKQLQSKLVMVNFTFDNNVDRLFTQGTFKLVAQKFAHHVQLLSKIYLC